MFGEGYGLTETSAGVTVTEAIDVVYGHVGTPVAAAEIKLVDVPDMEYLTSDRPHPRGEVWIRGPCVFQGYYKQKDLTDEVMEDGWFKSGDIGLWTESGDLKIIDRKKNIFKLSQGEYIRPEYIEGVYKQSTLIANIYVHGNSSENFLVGIVVPNMELLKTWAMSPANGVVNIANNPEELVKNARVKKYITKSMEGAAAQEKLRGFELVKDIRLVTEDFSVANDLLTPSFKLKRHVAQKRFANEIHSMYEDLKNGKQTEEKVAKSKL